MNRLMSNTALLLTIGFLFSASCSGAKEAGSVAEVSVPDFISAYQAGNLQILDVRTPEEYSQDGHVAGARLVSLQDLESQGQQAVIPFAKTDKIYVICRSGNRSLRAARLLKELGYQNLVSVKGGTMGWIMAGQPVEH